MHYVQLRSLLHDEGLRLLKRLTDHFRPATCEEDEDEAYLTFFPAFGCILAEGTKK